jgi:hypothetical protein
MTPRSPVGRALVRLERRLAVGPPRRIPPRAPTARIRRGNAAPAARQLRPASEPPPQANRQRQHRSQVQRRTPGLRGLRPASVTSTGSRSRSAEPGTPPAAREVPPGVRFGRSAECVGQRAVSGRAPYPTSGRHRIDGWDRCSSTPAFRDWAEGLSVLDQPRPRAESPPAARQPSASRATLAPRLVQPRPRHRGGCPARPAHRRQPRVAESTARQRDDRRSPPRPAARRAARPSHPTW